MNFIWLFLLFLSGNGHRRQRLHRRLRRKVRHERYPSYYKKVTRILVLKIIKTKGRIMSIDCLVTGISGRAHIRLFAGDRLELIFMIFQSYFQVW